MLNHFIAMRVKNIILAPEKEWAVINEEPTSLWLLVKNYAVFLAGAYFLVSIFSAAVISYIFFRLLNFDFPSSEVFHWSYVVYSGGITFFLQLVLVVTMSYLVAMISPSFGGSNDPSMSGKLIIYSATAFWISGIVSLLLTLIPIVGWILVIPVRLLGLAYSSYLIYKGAGALLGVPDEKLSSAVVVILLVYAFTGLVFLGISNGLSSFFFGLNDAGGLVSA